MPSETQAGDDFELPAPLMASVASLRAEFDAGAIVVEHGLWNEAVFEELRAFVEKARPRDHLAEIRAAADELRASIEALFPLAEVLWKVGSKSFRDTYKL